MDRRCSCLPPPSGQASVAAALVGCLVLLHSTGVAAWYKEGSGVLRLGCQYKTGWYENSAGQTVDWWQQYRHKSHKKVNQFACTILNTGPDKVYHVKLSCRHYHPQKAWHINDDCSIPGVINGYGKTTFVYQTTHGPAKFGIRSYRTYSGGGGGGGGGGGSNNESPGLKIGCDLLRKWTAYGLTYRQFQCALTNSLAVAVTNVTLNCPGYNPIVKWGQITWYCALIGTVPPNGGKITWGYETHGEGTDFSIKDYNFILDAKSTPINCVKVRTWKVAGKTYSQYNCALSNKSGLFLSNIVLSCPSWAPGFIWGRIRRDCRLSGVVQPGNFAYWGYQTTGSATNFTVATADGYLY